MKVGVNVLNYGPGVTAEAMESWVGRAERLGFHLAMISDHITLPPEVAGAYPPPFYDPFTTLAWLAGRTETIALGTTVAVLPYRHPLHTARVAANLDNLSGGRLVLGVGAGWSRQEFDALGVDFDARGSITGEYLQVITRHWAEPTLTFHGEHVAFDDVATGPAPLQRPHPPVWVGGLTDAALDRAARFADAWHPYGMGAAELRARLPVLAAAAEKAGRPTPALAPRIALHLTDRPVPDDKRTAGYGTVEQVRADLHDLADLGVSHVLLDTYLTAFLGLVPPEESPRHDRAMLETAAEELVDLAGERPR